MSKQKTYNSISELEKDLFPNTYAKKIASKYEQNKSSGVKFAQESIEKIKSNLLHKKHLRSA